MSNETTTDQAARYLSDEQIDTLAEWLVRNGGEKFNELFESYDNEVREGIMSVLDEDLDKVTPKDYVRIEALVAGATVNVFLPHLRHDPLTRDEVMELANRVADECPVEDYEQLFAKINELAPHKLGEHDWPLVYNTTTTIIRRRNLPPVDTDEILRLLGPTDN